ncbi:hypothetical protein WS86_27095 [Burkholderia savannae]|uniref:Abasic site processing protein n=1 Tax=Burkholderia savannae TaxID=1637837 RepID=A0ABR5T3S1_9BURK|nr:SOS response-associated peptidase family protein [Burkholderia savannae]AOJ84231.1 hypothetical protein WS86_27095 [Burkholderia savannae]KWZ37824.1 hypothetical protein WS72_23110 [Burkholderia savannae]
MCTIYRSPTEDPGMSELRISIGDLYRRTPWDPEVYPDYAAPIVRMVGGEQVAHLAVFGFWPRFMQPERHDEQGRKKQKLNTVNARAETIGSSRLYGAAWRAGQRCLIPVEWIYEPCYETGRNVWHRVGLAGWRPYCVAGVWKQYEDEDGRTLTGMSMLTVNAADHAILSRMHKPGDEKRSIVILRTSDYDEWLGTKNVDAARLLLNLYPDGEMTASPAA